MRIDNKTCWRTADLRRILTRVAKEEFPDPMTRKRLRIEIIYTRGWFSGCSGWGRYGILHSCIRVPNPHGKYARAAVKLGRKLVFPNLDFAHVAGHEFAHNRGVHHRQMGFEHGRRGRYSDEHYAWAKDIPVRMQEPKRAPSADQKREKALKAAHAAVARYQRRLKLDKTLLTKWQRRVRVLEKRIRDAEAALPKAAITKGGDEHEGTDNLERPILERCSADDLDPQGPGGREGC